MKEAYCSFEVARLLKEKGFNEPCLLYYDKYHGCVPIYVVDSEFPFYGYKYMVRNDQPITSDFIATACTHQMAMAWLRETMGIYITIIYGDYPSLKKVFWTPQIDSLEGYDLPESFYKEYSTYEEAVEAALKYALENLVKEAEQ